MKTKLTLLTLTLVALPASASRTAAQGTALTYQGRLNDAAGPANGTYDFQFTVRDALTGGNAIGLNPLPATLAVSNGLFTVTLDPGPGVFTGAERWLETAVRTNGAALFATLSPCQPLSATPYAVTAGGVSGPVPASQLTGTIPLAQLPGAVVTNGASGVSVSGAFSGNGAGLTSLPPNVARLDDSQTFTGVNNFGQGVTVNGNLGIGTTIPGARLDIRGGDAPVGAAALFVGPPSGTAGQRAIAGLWSTFTNAAADTAARRTADLVAGFDGGAWGSEYLALLVGNNGVPNDAAALTSEKLRITAGGNVGIGTTTPTAKLHVNGGIKVEGTNTLEFGADVAGKEPNAGKIGYQVFTPDSLDIIGAGTTGSDRKIRFWSEGGATFNGSATFNGNANVTGSLSAGIFFGNGAGLTLPANVTRLDANQTFTGTNTFSAELTAPVVTITGGSDVAEPYHVANAGDIKPIPGMVVAIDSEQIGQMRVAARAYDRTVAGILSGANGISPGLTLRQAGTVADGTLPVASIGRVWCYCDADANGSIEAGDTLTTSDTPGHAMRVGDFDRANGSVIGKAMSQLKCGRGLVLVLVSLK